MDRVFTAVSISNRGMLPAARIAASSSRAWDLKRPSQNRPAQWSSRLAWRAMDSLSTRMNQEMLLRRERHSSMISSDCPGPGLQTGPGLACGGLFFQGIGCAIDGSSSRCFVRFSQCLANASEVVVVSGCEGSTVGAHFFDDGVFTHCLLRSVLRVNTE